LEDRETSMLGKFFEDHRRLKHWLAESDGHVLRELLRPDAEFDAVSREDLQRLQSFAAPPLPRDDEGYVVSFPVDDVSGIRQFFEAYGLVVVRGVLSKEACAASRSELWDLLEREVPSLKRDEPETWSRWTGLADLGFVGMSFPLSPQLCRNRVDPQVHAAFAAIFGRPDLHVNVGRLGAMRPTKADGGSASPMEDRPHWRTAAGAEWLHWDANPWSGGVSSFSWRLADPRANRSCGLAVQAILALGDCHELNGGFFCVPGSHKIFRAWAREHPQLSKQMLSPEGPMQLQLPDGDPLKKLGVTAPIREGDLLIWDTRLAHCNYPNNSGSPRLVQYIQMKLAEDPVMLPLLDDASLLPPATEFELTPLARKLLAIDSW